MLTTILIFLVLLLASGCSFSFRKRIILLDSGISKSEIPPEYLCDGGHRSFIKENDDPFKDETGHGTVLAKIISEKIDPKEFCIVSYKIYPGYPYPYAYAEALNEVQRTNAVAIVIAMEDVSYYLDEVSWFTTILEDKKVFIAAGNGGKNLSNSCEVYPACLAPKLKSENFLVVGATTFEFNQGGPINLKAYPHFHHKSSLHSGTSISTARAVAAYFNKKYVFDESK